jgi:hypothetical protein
MFLSGMQAVNESVGLVDLGVCATEVMEVMRLEELSIVLWTVGSGAVAPLRRVNAVLA